jgi:hypothetical protein
MFSTQSMSLSGIVLLSLASGVVIPAKIANAATAEFPAISCQRQTSVNSYLYNCAISANASTKSVKVIVYYAWRYIPSGTTASKPFNSTAQCSVLGFDPYGRFTSGAQAYVDLPVTKRETLGTGKLILASAANFSGGYELDCDMPFTDDGLFGVELESFRVITQ